MNSDLHFSNADEVNLNFLVKHAQSKVGGVGGVGGLGAYCSCHEEIVMRGDEIVRRGDFNIPRFNSVNYGKHSLRYLGPVIWSRLKNDIRNAPSLKYVN